MARGPSPVRITDMKRAIQAVKDSGMEIAQIVVERDGQFKITPGKPGTAAAAETPEDIKKLL